MKVVFDERVFDEFFFDEIDHFHPNFDESVPNRPLAVGSQQVGATRLPASLFRTPIDGPGLQPHAQDHTLCVSVLSCPPWPCNHRMCVVAEEMGQSPFFQGEEIRQSTHVKPTTVTQNLRNGNPQSL